jgi:PHD/YefM family antitoxin component YafN of YafNO toxin-antitoxin module
VRMLSKAIVSNSAMIKNYKTCREKAEDLGKVFVVKNNQPDAVLFSIGEYEKRSEVIEHSEGLEENDTIQHAKTPRKEGDEEKQTPDGVTQDNDAKKHTILQRPT